MTPKTEGQAVETLARIKGAPFRAYRERWDRVNTFDLETDFPMFLHIEPNYKCNFECPMCTQGNPELKAKFGYDEQITSDQVAAILEEGRRHGCPSISFQGDNEPFLIKALPDWFAMARDAGFLDIMVNTNGSVMTPRLAERILDSGLTRIRFSLDAVTRETYEKIRLKGDFNKVRRNIRMFLEARAERGAELPVVGVNFVKMAVNAHEVEPFIAEWNDKVDFIVIQDFMTPDIEGDYAELDIENREPVDDFKCAQPWQRLYIRGNGDVTACCAMFNKYLKLGELGKNSLQEIWQSKAASDLRRLHKEGRYRENAVCLKCSKNGGAEA